MSENPKTEFSGRRKFIGKLSTLGALSVSDNLRLHPKFSCCIQHVIVKNTTAQSAELFFIEKAKFTLGDPYYTMPAVQDSEHYTETLPQAQETLK